MARSVLSSECDELERVMRKRNEICSELFLRALQVNHGELPVEPFSDLDQGEPTPEPEPEAQDEPLTDATITEQPIVMNSLNKIEHIKRVICKRFGISKADIEGQCRMAKYNNPRQIAMHLCRKHTTHSFPEIGRRFGGRDHTTILHAFHKITRLAASDTRLAAQLAELGAEIPA